MGLREYTLLSYGKMLMANGFWQVGADYLAHCPTNGLGTLQEV